MINREHISDLAFFRHTDFGYFAGGGSGGRGAPPVPRQLWDGAASFTGRNNDRPASNQSPRSAVTESYEDQLPLSQHNNVTAASGGSKQGRGGGRW